MSKIINAFTVCLLLLFSTSYLQAENTDTFQQERQQTEQDYADINAEMAKFVILEQAKDRSNKLLKSLDNWPAQQQRILYNMTNDRGLSGLLKLLGTFTLMMVSGLILEKLAGLKLNSICNRLAQQTRDTAGDHLKFLLARGAFQFLGLGVFTLVGGAIAVFSFSEEDPSRVLSLFSLILVIKIRALAIILNLMLRCYIGREPQRTEKFHAARRLSFSILLFVSLYLLITTTWRLLGVFSIDAVMFSMIIPLSGLLLNFSSIGLMWFNQKVITDMFTTATGQSSSFGQLFSQIWPTLLTFWLLVIWTIWAANEFLGNYAQAQQLTPAWWLTFTFPFIDRIVFVILSQLKRISWLQSHSYEQRCDVFISRVIIAIRIILFSVIVYLVHSSFGYNSWEMLATQFGGFLKSSVDVLIVIIFAYAIWEIIQSAIERHLPYDLISGNADDALAALESDGGGAGASRSETLLPLVRSFLLAFLVLGVTLTILSIVGVEIAPLLAGAGIIGIAVGFGAQKLVQDVISGIFFLLDDAFRRGEYIEAANLRGTVERISIRSIRLRHHLGAVQTIPFSEIATVRNLSRDWISMKLEFRLNYRTNVEKVRKLIKKVGLEMLEHPVYGQHFLLPLKSQGVIRVEESALIFRMKFTCVPGEQWVIRREAFRLVKDSLKDNGIEFAHRSVHVLMQETDDTHLKSSATPAVDQLKEMLEQDEALQKKLLGGAASTIESSIKAHDKIDHDSQ